MYVIDISKGDDGKWSAAATDTLHAKMVYACAEFPELAPLLSVLAFEVERAQGAFEAEQRGKARQGINGRMYLPKSIKHNDECIRRHAYIQAWDILWPNRCAICFGAGGKEYPATREDPGDYETCSCVNVVLCSRCMRPAYGFTPWRNVAYYLRELLQMGDRAMRLRLGVTYPGSMSESWQVAQRRYTDEWYRPIYRPMAALAEFFLELAEQAEPTEESWNDGSQDPKPCIHCGFGFGKHDGDVRPEPECYCEIGV